MSIWLNFFLIYNALNGILQTCSAARILVYTPLPFYSHQVAYRPLWKELANRGHNITLITLNPMEPHENITQIDLSTIYGVLERTNYFDVLSSGEQSLKNVKFVFDLMVQISDVELSQPNVKSLLVNGDEKFDLVITEFYLILGAAFAQKYNCPFIGVVSMDAQLETHNMFGNPTHPILYPALDLGFSGKLKFRQRLLSLIFYLFWPRFLNNMHDQENIIVKKHFGNDVPSLFELRKNMSMLFINSNPVFHTVRPLNSQTINVGGGLHMEEPKPLPKDIQEFLDNSQEGVVYFSLGSSIRSSQLSNKTKSVIIEAFSQLPYKILWKFERDGNDSFSIPKNVHLWKWLPQQDVLRHPNVKLFITQGGLQSLEEALFIGVPVLVLPFFGDQISNAQRTVEHGFGLSLDHKTLEVAEFKATILKILRTSSYKESAIRLAKQLRDRPWTGVERAAWWTEYVLRNRDLSVLRHPNSDLPLYQYFFLDIALFCLCICLALVYCVKLLIRAKIFVLVYLLEKGRKAKSQ